MENTRINEVLQQFGRDTIDKLQKSIDSKGINATRKLRQSIDFKVINLGTSFEFKLGWTGDADHYASAAETGRKPGKMPPLEPIMKWIAAKGIKLPEQSSLSKRRIKSLSNKVVKKSLRQISTTARAKSLAYLIARKIGKEGTKASHFFSDVVNDKLYDDLRAKLKAAAKKDILIELRKG